MEKFFIQFKQALSSTPMLILPSYSLLFILETNACSRGIRVVLMQQGRFIAFYGKALGLKSLGFSTYEKELLAIIMSVSKWRTYLLRQHFIIHIKQQSIKFFMEQRLTTLLQQ